MKKYVKASAESDYRSLVRRVVRDIANKMYNVAPLSDDDPRCDYFVENICEDSDVLQSSEQLVRALEKACDRQMRY